MTASKTQTGRNIPVSAANYGFNGLVMALFFALLFGLNSLFPGMDRVLLTTLCLLGMAAILIINDLVYGKVQHRPSTGLLAKPGSRDYWRLAVKLIGLYGTYAVILLLYFLNPFYRDSAISIQFYRSFFIFLQWTAPAILILSFVYFWYVDPRQKDPYDEYWHMGCFLTGQFKKANVIILQEHARVWFIKGFFTPFMFSLLVKYVDVFLSFQLANIFMAPTEYLLTIFYMVDVAYGVLGYILTMRLLDNHIRSTEPTIVGWMTCLMAYSPFYLVGLGLFPYDDGLNWNHWFSGHALLYILFGTVIVVLSLVYALATVAFGYRMSNLTYRGIITAGPYRFSKHPAYLCKVASWWLITLPFIPAQDPQIALYYTLNLVFVSFIYYLRAVTEENHLSNYPEYVDYANQMNTQGIFSPLGRYIPVLQYSEERAKRSKSVVWFKKLK